MSFNIPDIEKVRSCSYIHHYADFKFVNVNSLFDKKELTYIDHQIPGWINSINVSILYSDEKIDHLRRAGWKLGKDYKELLDHPMFKRYLNELVKNGYCVKIAKLPEPCIHVYWNIGCCSALIWLEGYDKEWEYERDKECDDERNDGREKSSNNLKLIGGLLISVILLTYFISRR